MIGEELNTIDLFDNPFEEINANVIDYKRIVEYWCDPFELRMMTGYDERRFRTSKVPIILQGSRGSGKTTILKYYSFQAQCERVKLFHEKSILARIKKEKEIGFYFRCEESFITTFMSIFRRVSPNNWTKIFECYIELFFSEKIIEMIVELQNRGEGRRLSEDSIRSIISKVGLKQGADIKTIDQLYNIVHNAILYFEHFKNNSFFSDQNFEPLFFTGIFTLSKAIVEELRKSNSDFENVLFVLLIDEYENLDFELQKRLNTIVKFINSDISIRIGRRSEGRYTTETVNDVEYLRENHDFYLASLDQEANIKMMKKFFLEIANHRFKTLDQEIPLNEKMDMTSMLGDMEDLVSECKDVCGAKIKHLNAVLKQSPTIAGDTELRKKIIEIIRNEDNPIAETVNALWVIRDKNKKYLEKAIEASSAMRGYFNNEDNKGVKKYELDYSGKYRYAITVFICSVYKREKMYYGFNAICHLSNGNIRAFINLCQAIVNDAMFYENRAFLKTGKVTNAVQSRAIRKYSRSEFDSICSVVYAGDKIRRLVLNIGNSLEAFHKDQRIRYPETTQFSLDASKLNDEDAEILRTAESWSIIIRRHKVQRASAGVNERTELFYLNKKFAPLFNISYRIRGGVNLRISPDEMHEMLNSDSYLPLNVKKLIAGQEIILLNDTNQQNQQLSFFDLEGEDE